MIDQPEDIIHVLLRERLRIIAIAAVILRDPHLADDIFQQVVLIALQDQQAFQDPVHVLAWSLRAARFRAIDLARRNRLTYLSDEVLDRLESRWSTEDTSEFLDRAKVLSRCKGLLPSHSLRLLQLRYEEGLPVVEVARKMQRSSEAIYKSLSRLHRVLRDCMQKTIDMDESRLVNEAIR